MGMEKFFDIVCRIGGLQPSAVVLVATVQGAQAPRRDSTAAWPTSKRGADNLARHLGIISEFGLEPSSRSTASRPTPTRRSSAVRRLALEAGAHAAEVNEAFERGGEGAPALAEAVVEAAESRARSTTSTRWTRRSSRRSTRSRRASTARDGVALLPAAQEKIARVRRRSGSATCRSAWPRPISRCRTTRR